MAHVVVSLNPMLRGMTVVNVFVVVDSHSFFFLFVAVFFLF
jgi:hypothetical protein